MKALLYTPIWFLQLFTTAKSFRDNPILGNATLNRWGLHITRLKVAHAIMRFRRRLLSSGISAEDWQSFETQGYILKENFLPAEHFTALEAEIRTYRGEVRECQQGDTQNHHTLLEPATLQQLPQTTALFKIDYFKRLMRYTGGHLRQPFLYIEQVRNGVAAGGKDPQKNLHSDTFHPTMKFWFFLDDVPLENGPFNYVPSSNQLTPERLAWEHKTSQYACKHADSYAARGSFRFETNDLAQLKLPAPKAFVVKKNSLLMADTFGIHARGQAEAGSTRLAIWGMSRTNPFNLFPGTGFTFVDAAQYKIVKALRDWEDYKAAKHGRKSAWHKI